MPSFAFQIQNIVKELEQYPDKLLKEVHKTIDFEQELKHTHKKAQDPYKERWPKREGNYSHPPLIKTGKLLNSYEQKRKRNKLSIKNTAPYSGYLQKRFRILPETDQGIPVHWVKQLNKVAQRLIREFNG